MREGSFSPAAFRAPKKSSEGKETARGKGKEIARGKRGIGRERDKKGRRDGERKSIAPAGFHFFSLRSRIPHNSLIPARKKGIGGNSSVPCSSWCPGSACLPVCLSSPFSYPLSPLEGRSLPALFPAALFLPLLLCSIDAEWSGLLLPFHVLFFVSSLILCLSSS